MLLSSKDPAERIVITFDFARSLIPGETIAAITSVTIENASDPLASSMLSDAPQLDGSQVLQEITGGLTRLTYHLRATVSTSNGRTLVNATYLPVRIV